MQMIYEFRRGSRYHGDAQAVGRELHEIRDHYGTLTPDLIVDAASSKSSVLHRFFEWDDTDAARQFRLWQARILVCSVVTVKVDEEESRPVRSFVNIDHSYQPIEVVLSDISMRERLLKDVLNGIESMQNKVRSYEELSDVLVSLDQAHQVAQRHFVRRARKAAKRIVKSPSRARIAA